MSEERATSVGPVMLVVAISLMAATGVVLLLCRWLLQHSLSWVELVLIAVGFVLAAVLAYATVLWVLAKAGHDHVEAEPRELILGSWAAVAWMPAMILLIRGHSIWIAALGPWMTARIAWWLARLRNASGGAAIYEAAPVAVAGGPAELTLFQFSNSPAILRNALPAVATSLAWQCGVAALAGGEVSLAALLFSSGVIFPCWYPTRMKESDAGVLRPVRASLCLLLAILATAVALMPMARYRGAAMRASALLGIAETADTFHPLHTTPPRGSHYSGVILTMPPRPTHHVVIPQLQTLLHPNPNSMPAVIPFDGAYWYFQVPDERPGADAYVMRGDPIGMSVRATNDYPLTMEAHQPLAEPIRLDCCRAIRMDLRSTEYGEGGIYIGLTLRNTMNHAAYTLDNRVLESSLHERLHTAVLAGAPTEESLSFPMPRVARGAQFNEIVVSIRFVRSAVLNGAHVAVKQFMLQR